MTTSPYGTEQEGAGLIPDDMELVNESGEFGGAIIAEMDESISINARSLMSVVERAALTGEKADVAAQCMLKAIHMVGLKCNQGLAEKIQEAINEDDLHVLEVLLPTPGQTALRMAMASHGRDGRHINQLHQMWSRESTLLQRIIRMDEADRSRKYRDARTELDRGRRNFGDFDDDDDDDRDDDEKDARKR